MKSDSAWKNLILWVVVIAVFAVFLHPRRTVNADANEGYLTITGASGYTVEIRYEDVRSAELRESMDYGTRIDGTDEKKEKSGLWNNDEFGQYRLCVNAKVPSCIILTTDQGVTVVNYESRTSTQQLYEAILRQLA